MVINCEGCGAQNVMPGHRCAPATEYDRLLAQKNAILAKQRAPFVRLIQLIKEQPRYVEADIRQRPSTDEYLDADVVFGILDQLLTASAEVVSPQQESAAVDLLRRLRQWDMFNPPDAKLLADAPYWTAEIDKVLAGRAAEVVSQPPQEDKC